MLLHIIFLFRTRSLASRQKRMDTNREDDTDCANLNLSPYLILSFSPLSFSLALFVCIHVVLWLGKDQVHNIITKKVSFKQKL
jgi:hypothetical protein